MGLGFWDVDIYIYISIHKVAEEALEVSPGPKMDPQWVPIWKHTYKNKLKYIYKYIHVKPL